MKIKCKAIFGREEIPENIVSNNGFTFRRIPSKEIEWKINERNWINFARPQLKKTILVVLKPNVYFQLFSTSFAGWEIQFPKWMGLMKYST